MFKNFKPKKITLPEGKVEVTVKAFADGQTLKQGNKEITTCVVTLETSDDTTLQGYLPEDWYEGAPLYNFVEAIGEDMTTAEPCNLDFESYLGKKLIANVSKKWVNGLVKCKVESYMKL